MQKQKQGSPDEHEVFVVQVVALLAILVLTSFTCNAESF